MITDFSEKELNLIVPSDAVGDFEKYKRLFYIFIQKVDSVSNMIEPWCGNMWMYSNMWEFHDRKVFFQILKKQGKGYSWSLYVDDQELAEVSALLFMVLTRFDMYLFSRIQETLGNSEILKNLDVFRKIVLQHNKLRQKILGRPLGLLDLNLKTYTDPDYLETLPLASPNYKAIPSLNPKWAETHNIRTESGRAMFKDILFSPLSDTMHIFPETDWFDKKFFPLWNRDLFPFVYFRLVDPTSLKFFGRIEIGKKAIHRFDPLPLIDILDLDHKMDSTRENLLRASYIRRTEEKNGGQSTCVKFRFITVEESEDYGAGIVVHDIDEIQIKLWDLFGDLNKNNDKFPFKGLWDFDNKVGGIIGTQCNGWVAASYGSDLDSLRAELVMSEKIPYSRGVKPRMPAESHIGFIEDWGGQFNDKNKELFNDIIEKGRSFLEHVFQRYPAHPLYMLVSHEMMRFFNLMPDGNVPNRCSTYTLWAKIVKTEYEDVEIKEATVRLEIYRLTKLLMYDHPMAVGLVYEYAITFRELFKGRLSEKTKRLKEYINMITDPVRTAGHGYMIYLPYKIYALRSRLIPLTNGFPLLVTNDKNDPNMTIIKKTDRTPWSEFEKKRYADILSRAGINIKRYFVINTVSSIPCEGMVVDLDFSDEEARERLLSCMPELFKVSEKFWQLYQQNDEIFYEEIIQRFPYIKSYNELWSK